MLTSAISGFVLFVIAVCVGPALLIAGFQMLFGERVRLPSIVKPLMQALFMLGGMFFDTAEVMANMVAKQLPPQYVQWQPAVRIAVKLAVVCTTLWLFWQFLVAQTVR